MNEQTNDKEPPRCLACGKAFAAGDFAGATLQKGEHDLQVVTCSHCSALNEIRTELAAGAGIVPEVAVVRVLEASGEVEPVFEETVQPGVKVPPKMAGSSD